MVVRWAYFNEKDQSNNNKQGFCTEKKGEMQNYGESLLIIDIP